MSGKRKSTKTKAAAKPRPERKPAAVNPQLTQQNRKLLGKHYANRFGKR
jgi:hypothetical protein